MRGRGRQPHDTRKTLNESPSEKEGKYNPQNVNEDKRPTLNESPSEKEGK